MDVIRLPDVAATEALASRLAKSLPMETAGWIVLLQGDLGAGKSTLARAMLREMGHDGPVPSPTYTLVEPYELEIGNIYHIDLYRISGLVELEHLGWHDLRDGLALVEWPERAPELREHADLQIALDYDGTGRAAVLQSLSDRGAAMLSGTGLGRLIRR